MPSPRKHTSVQVSSSAQPKHPSSHDSGLCGDRPGFAMALLLLPLAAFTTGCATLGLGEKDPSTESEKDTPQAEALARLESRLDAFEKRLSDTERTASLARKDFSRFQHETQDLRNQLLAVRKRADRDERKRRSGLAMDFDDTAAARVEAKESASAVAPLPPPEGSFSPEDQPPNETQVRDEGSPARLTDEAEEKMRLARYGEAVVLLSEVQSRFPQFEDGGRSLVMLANGWLKLGEPQNALPALRQVYARFPTSALLPDAKLIEARAHEQMGTRQRALALYRELLATGPEGPQGQEARAALTRLRDAQ